MLGIHVWSLAVERLILTQPLAVTDASFDPTRLPWVGDETDENADNVFLGDEVGFRPLQNRNLILRPGVHLHWRLPRHWTVEGPHGGLPLLPNRWLITCRSASGARRWLLESNYLHPAGAEPPDDSAVALPDLAGNGRPPFRWAGRSRDLAQALSEHPADKPQEYLWPFTAGGYGSPDFSAFLPNHRGLLSFYDPVGHQQPDAVYAVLGWYEGIDDTSCRLWQYAPDRMMVLVNNPELGRRANRVPPAVMYGRTGNKESRPRQRASGDLQLLTPRAKRRRRRDRETQRMPAVRGSRATARRTLAVGHSPLEAVIAFLAQRLAPDHRVAFEEQLQAIALAADLASCVQDHAARLAESWHEHGFVAQHGGTHWIVRPQAINDRVGQAANTSVPAGVAASGLAPEVNCGEALAELQRAQRAVDELTDQQVALRHRLAADWHKYLRCAYPPADTPYGYPDPDRVKHLIEEESLPQLERNQQALQAAERHRTACQADVERRLEAANLAGLQLAPADVTDAATWLTGLLRNDPSLLYRWREDASLPQEWRIAVGQLRPLSPTSTDSQSGVASATPATLLAQGWNRLTVDQLRRWVTPSPSSLKDGTWNPQQADEVTLRWYLRQLPGVTPGIGQRLTLVPTPGPRYWTPREPQVVLEVPDEIASFLPADDSPASEQGTAPLGKMPLSRPITDDNCQKVLLELEEQFRHAAPVVDLAGDEPARPVYADWAATLRPPTSLTAAVGPGDGAAVDPLTAFEGGAVSSEPRPAFPRDLLTAAFAPAAMGPEVVPLSGAVASPTADPHSYAGRGLVVPQAARVLQARLADFLVRQFAPLYSAFPQLAPSATLADQQQALKQLDWAAALAFVRGKNPQTDPAWSTIETALRTYQELLHLRLLCLPLAGFNEALLMRRQAVQLPVDDPLGFREYRDFAARVARAIAELPVAAPAPRFRFLPLRSGTLQLDALRILDTFGRGFDLDVSDYEQVCSATRVGADGGGAPWLPPRSIAPLRAHFSWLDANQANSAANSASDTSPVCGWLLPNVLDQALDVYDAAGLPLGSLDEAGHWRPAPGSNHPCAPPDIPNQHLRRVVLYLLAQARDGEYHQTFLRAILAALEAIDPDSAAAHPSLALLMGRPLAVVRATAGFELRGEPPEDHSWDTLRDRVAGHPGDRTRGFPRVALPFRIGEHHQRNDGVAGYWVEPAAAGAAEATTSREPPSLPDDRATFDGPFRVLASSAELPVDPRIVGCDPREVPHGEEPPAHVLARAPAEAPLVLTLLLDPRGTAHLTSGLVPVKEIRLAEQQYVEALRQISVTFLTAPLLHVGDRTEIPLPGEPGYAWSYLEYTPQGWQETDASRIVPPELSATFRGPARLREGWLRLRPRDDDRA